MKRILVFLLVCLLLFSLPACVKKAQHNTQSTTTAVATTTTAVATTTTAVATTTTAVATTTTAVATTTTAVASTTTQALTQAEAQKIAEEKITAYWLHLYTGLCCNTQWVEEDMSRFLTDEQLKDYYPGSQHKINCCSSPKEVQAHLLQTMDKNLINDSPDNLLFYDDQGNLYAIVPGMGINLLEIKVSQFSPDRIVAIGEEYLMGELDEVCARYTFILQKNNNNFVITNVD